MKPVFEDLLVTEGWDGIHIRGCEQGIIRRSTFQTGDDCIAGGYWNQMLIEDCDINSSCNGIRMIMPSDGLEVRNCVLHGPGVYPHRTSGEEAPPATSTCTTSRCTASPLRWAAPSGKVP